MQARAVRDPSFWLGLFLALLLARSMRALLSTLYYESLASFRLVPSAWWTVALAAPAVAIVLASLAERTFRRPSRPWIQLTTLVAGVATTGLAFTRFTDAYVPLAALAASAALLALARAGALAGLVVGLGVDGALLVLGNSVEPATLVVPVLATLGALALGRGAAVPPAPPRASWAAGAAAALLVALEVAFLASPFGAARWAGIPAWLAGAASALGLLVGATRLRHAGGWLLAAGAFALVDLSLAVSPFVALSLAIVQAALGAGAARLGPGLATPSGGIAFGLTIAPSTFLLAFYGDQLGVSEWGVLVPLLAVLAIVPTRLHAAPSRAPRRAGAIPAALLVAAAILGAAVPQPIAPASEGDLTLVSWNVHQAFGNRGGLDPWIYADVLRDLSPDIVVLQESHTARLSSGGVDIVKFLAAELDMRAAYGRSGVAVLSRLPFADAPRPPEAEWTFELGLDVNGTTLWVHGVHLARGRFADTRSHQVDELLADPVTGPHILAGDLNTCATARCAGFTFRNETPPRDEDLSPLYARLVTRYHDTWTLAGHSLADPAGYTHPADRPGRRIDHVLVEGIEVVDTRVVRDDRTRAASDHYPVLVTVRLAAP